MQTKEAEALKVVLTYEGGRVDDPDDKGGRTNMGITQRVYDAYRKNKKQARRDVWKITSAEVAAIYDTQYWDKIRGDEVPAGIDLVLFDGAVNSGPSQSIKWLQRALGSKYTGKEIDGVWGEATKAALRSVNDHDQLIADMLAARLLFLKHLDGWGKYGKGWTNRILGVKKIGQAWAKGSVGPDPVFHENGNIKALVSDAKVARSSTPADASIGVGGSSVAAATAIEGAKSSLEPLAGSSNIIAYIVAALAVAGIAVVIGGFAYKAYVNKKNARLATALNMSGAIPQ